MELADSRALFAGPLHPYTRALVSAAPIPDPAIERARTRIVLPGEVAGPLERAAGCRFEPRCPVGNGRPACRGDEPALLEMGPGQWAACHYAGEAPTGEAVHDGYAFAEEEQTQ
jgi:oligopeptide/dipeptide ABC transporter ATP-binding protein